MTEYAVLIVGDADRWSTSFTQDERRAAYAEYDRFTEELTRRGHAITAGAELDDADRARTVRPGGREVTDGPFAESAEQVGGFFMVETDDLADLEERCRIIAALGDAVEIRPTTSDESRS